MDQDNKNTANVVELRAGDLRLALRPDLGGSIAGLWLGDTPVLRSVDPAALTGPRQSGCFPLVPYSNRLGYRRFRWQGREYSTLPNFGDDSDASWPFTFDVSQRFELSDNALALSMHFTNIDARSQPVGLGWHPYFPKRARSRIHVECSGRWESDVTTHLPTRRVAQSGIDGEVRHLDFDHCFDGWRGAARVRDERMSVALTSSLPYLVVFTPPTRDHFCIEPVSHVNNAIHMADPASHGLKALGAAETLEAWMKIEVTAA
jgi:aldose 1-epimerase